MGVSFDGAVYFDHNILNQILRGDPKSISALVRQQNLQPVYSFANLREISKSQGFQNNFLELLKNMSAAYLFFDQYWNIHLEIRNPREVFSSQNFSEHSMEQPFNDFVRQFYGGSVDENYAAIIKPFLLDLKDAVSDMGENSSEVVAALNFFEDQFPVLLKDISLKMCESRICELDSMTGGQREVNNISSPDVVRKIYHYIMNKEQFEKVDCDVLFGLNLSHVKTQGDKVSQIYMMLNNYGYYRDTEIKTKGGISRMSGDILHAGIASYCGHFYSADKRLAKKAEAAYEYLGIKTEVTLF